ncbi:MAG: AAA family ATPase [Nitrososphaerota archaeon]|jgi:circadian clock protein KaiC|nr:AAA family ATPase [Nitrososphaerota archaeon]MDG6922026.1 AAA family ATPase [Nitrososphaerota archaeon]
MSTAMLSGPDRIPTGISGLDSIIQGGLIRGDVHLISGGPGTGKTILASRFVYNAIRNSNEIAVYATFEESTDFFKRNLARLGSDFAPLEKEEKIKIIDLEILRGKGLESNIAYLLDVVAKAKATILVVDSLTALLLACETQFEQRTFMKTVYKSLKVKGVTTLMTVSLGEDGRVGPEGFLSDSVMFLENWVDNNQFKTRFLIQKMRGTDHSRRYHSLSLGPEISISRF